MRHAHLALVVLASCGGTVAASDHAPATNDASVADSTPGQDAAVLPDSGFDAVPEAALDAPVDVAAPCTCQAGEVWRDHECVPTHELGCGPSCDPGAPACPDKHECAPCGASSSCATDDCQATCIFVGPAMGPIAAGALRIWPTIGTAGQQDTITVSGFPFYVGALYYGVKVGAQDVSQTSGVGVCSFNVQLPAMPPSMVAVRVSQYGPEAPWVVAGFYTFSAGDIPDCVQPGYPCSQAQECCTTADAPMACVAHRCMEQ